MRFVSLLLVLFFVSLSQAATVQLVRTDVLPHVVYGAYQEPLVEPIVDLNGNWRGMVVAPFGDSVEVHLFGRDSAILLPVTGNKWNGTRIASCYRSDDTLAVYVLTAATLHLFLIDTAIISSKSVLLPLRIGGEMSMTSEPEITVLYDRGVPASICFTSLYEESYPEETIGQGGLSMGQAFVLSLNLEMELTLGNYRMTGGNFGENDSFMLLGYQNFWFWFDYYEGRGEDYDYQYRELSLLSVSGDTLLDVKGPHVSYGLGILAGNFLPETPEDEILYYGHDAPLETGDTTMESYMACYRLAAGGLQRIWYRALSSVENIPKFFYAAGGALVARPDSSRTLFFSARTGMLGDSAQLDRPLDNARFFQVGSNPPLLHIIGVRGDTVFTYRFDAITDVEDDKPSSAPASFTLHQNFPNPFNPSTTIAFDLPRAEEVTLTIYNLLGEEVNYLLDHQRFSAGTHQVTWEAQNCASGIYLYQLRAGDKSQSRKMLLLK